MTRIGWLDPSNGVSGDMLLGALVDAGARPAELQSAVDSLGLPEDVRLVVEKVRRGPFAATRVRVETQPTDRRRGLGDILALIDGSSLPDRVRADADRVFTLLAEAEAAVHGQPVDQVHFHEVGALDSIADVVGAVAGVHALAIDRLVCGPLALGGGRVNTDHGPLPVPGPAVLRLLAGTGAVARGGPVELELATPTGVALALALADSHGPMPPLSDLAVGVGAGRADPPGHANVTRLVVGTSATADDTDIDRPGSETQVCVEATVDDLDPRLWPSTIDALLAVGARDAWLTPVLMKKGRPGHVLSVLTDAELVDEVLDVVFTRTTTIGIRSHGVDRVTLARELRPVRWRGEVVRVKVARWRGAVVNAVPEYEDVVAAADRAGVAPKLVLDEVRAVARDATTES